MLAIGLTLGLFAYWLVLGHAVLSTLRLRMLPLRQALLAPVVGAVVNALSVLALNRLMPVGRFGYALAVAMGVAAAGLLFLRAGRSAPFPRGPYWPFAAVSAAAVLLIGWPMFEFGFDWLSLCNPDMGNYSLGAVRLFHHAFFDTPTAESLAGGRDYSLFYWFHYVPGSQRAGSELLIAWLMSLTGLSPHQVFMPLILAFHAVLVSATGALVYRGRSTYAAALTACALTAASALTAWGTLYQLVAQVAGIAVLAGCATVLMRRLADSEDDQFASSDPGPSRRTSTPASPTELSEAAAPSATPRVPRRWLVREGILLGILGAGLIVIYPEVTPFLGAAWVLYLCHGLVGRWRGVGRAGRAAPAPGGLKAAGTVAAVAALTLLALLWRYSTTVVLFLLHQIAFGSQGTEVQKVYFPFYLVPSGLANLWGFVPLSRVPPDPLASLAIASAGLLLLLAAALCAWAAWRGQPVAFVAGVMLALMPLLYAREASFGLYKMAMFIQPFLLGTVAVGWAMLAFRRPLSRRGAALRAAPLVLLALPGLSVQQQYVDSARDKGGGVGFGEVPGASYTRVNHDFRRVLARYPDRPAGLVADTHNPVLAMFQAAYARGTETAFPSVTLGTTLARRDWGEGVRPPGLSPAAPLRELTRAMLDRIEPWQFNLHDGGGVAAAGAGVNPFRYRGIGPMPSDAPDVLVVSPGPRQTVLNRWHHPARAAQSGGRPAEAKPTEAAAESGDNFFGRRMRSVRDHLVFVDSDLGRSYFLNAENISLYQLEPDPMFYRGTSMAGAGRHLLFQVLNPSPQVRLEMEITDSLNGDGDNSLPPAAAVGDRRERFPTTGRGSARVFSPPLRPQEIGGRLFLAIDGGRPAQPLAYRRSGLMRMYGRGVNLDWRRLIGFARDISAVSDRQYLALKPPAAVKRFPQDLQDNRLEYSGVYEDGLASEHAWFALGQPWDAARVAVRGKVPDLGDPSFATEMTVLIDGEEVGRQALEVGRFELTVPLPKDAKPQVAGRRRVELRFSGYQHLQAPDGRPITMQIEYVGFESTPAAPVAVRDFPGDLANPLLEVAGLDGDRWAAQKVSLRLTQPPDGKQLVVRGMVPNLGGPSGGTFGTTLRLLVDGQAVGEQRLGVDRFEVRADVAPLPSPGARRVELEFSDVQRLPAPDVRAVACQVTSIGFEPPAAQPSRVARFPEDVRDPLLRASGLFEDGWVGAAASVELTHPDDAEELVIKGMVPRLGGAGAGGFGAEMSVLVDGGEVARQVVAPGEVDVRVPTSALAGAAGGPRRVEVRFSATQTLPAPDGRAIGARISFLGFTRAGAE